MCCESNDHCIKHPKEMTVDDAQGQRNRKGKVTAALQRDSTERGLFDESSKRHTRHQL